MKNRVFPELEPKETNYDVFAVWKLCNLFKFQPLYEMNWFTAKLIQKFVPNV